MYQVSELYKSKIQELERTFQIKIQIQHSQGVLNLTDKDIVSGSLAYTERSQAGEDFTIGGTVASELKFSLLNKPEYADIEFMGATVIVHVGLLLIEGMGLTYEDLTHYTYEQLMQFTYGQLGNDVWEYVPLGIFNIDDIDKQRNSIKIRAVDNMINLDKPYHLSRLGYPATLFQIYVDICNVCDVMVGTIDFPNKDYVVQERPAGDYTFRDILGYVTELSGTFARMSRSGALELVWYKNTDKVITPANRFDFLPRDDKIRITGVMATIDDTTYLAGTDEYVVDLSENPLLQGDHETVLPIILDNIKNLEFTPYECRWQGDPALQAGDIITQVDRDGNIYTTIVTSSTYKYRGASTLKAEGLPMVAKGYKGSTNKRISNIVRKEIKPIGDQLTTLEQAQLHATQLIANMLGGYAIQGPDAFYVADNPDLQQAVKVWKFGLGGFGYSNNGVGGPYETAVTADGSIVAMLVAAGIVTADMIQTGLLQSQDGSTWINLDDGWFNFKNTLKWDGQAIQVLDNLEKERVRIGNYAEGKYGLLIKDSSGDKTLLDEDGLLQTWQEGRADNVDSTHPLVLNVFLPGNTRSVNQAILRFRLEPFRTHSKGIDAASSTVGTSGSSSISTTEGGGNHRHQMMNYVGSVSEANYLAAQAYQFTAGDSGGGNGATFFIKSPGGNIQIYTKGASGEHSHGMQHTHSVTIPKHAHDIEYGIFESTTPQNVKIKVNGASVGGTYNSDQNNIDIRANLNIGQWNTIELSSTRLGRIDATVFIQALMGVN